MTSADMTSPCNATGTCDDVGDTGSEVWETLMAVYLGAILLLSLAFNGTLCLVFIKKPHLLSISNCFVLNLACCHLCMSVLVLPFSLLAVVSQGSWIYRGPWCEFQGFFFTTLIVTMQFALLIVSIDRNYAIMNSLRYPNVFTQTLCSLLIGGSWLIAIALSIPPLLHSKAGEYNFHPHQFLCTLDWSSNSAYLIVFSVISFAIPILSQSFCYLKIFKAAIGHSKRTTRIHPIPGQPSTSVCIDPPTMTGDSVTGSAPEYTRRKTTAGCKAVRTIFIIALTYSICWVPYLIDCLLTYHCDIRLPHLSSAALCLVFSTGILNPIIYGYMNRVIRREIGRFLCGNPAINDTEDFVSTSMSTFSSARKTSSVWVTQQSRAQNPVSGDMGTIEEETEDNVPVVVVKKDSTSIQRDQRTEGTEAVQETDNRMMQLSSTEIVSGSVKTENYECQQVSEQQRVDDGTNAICDNKNTLTSQTQVFSASSAAEKYKKVTPNGKPDKRVRERRRSSGSKAFEAYFSKASRKKRRDCGSFLFFDAEERLTKSAKAGVRKKRRRERDQGSVDHVQNISMPQVPKSFKFRFSLTGGESSSETLTVRSDVRIQNQAFSSETETSETSSNDGMSRARS